MKSQMTRVITSEIDMDKNGETKNFKTMKSVIHLTDVSYMYTYWQVNRNLERMSKGSFITDIEISQSNLVQTCL